MFRQNYNKQSPAKRFRTVEYNPVISSSDLAMVAIPSGFSPQEYLALEAEHLIEVSDYRKVKAAMETDGSRDLAFQERLACLLGFPHSCSRAAWHFPPIPEFLLVRHTLR